ncbi:putative Fungal-specific transcription factor domain-containing protein [Seiridium cardinale]|uniref:Fungal-specific transcription factor domain-containing protein n=1 Tax=Seiridium cardinale TaxID=138064 RepID=A0ABR2Y9M4_9PEZI
MSIFNAEMRRRLWNTTLEIVIQSSIDSGGPAMISSADFDTEPPGNFDDVQLMADSLGTSDPEQRPPDLYTQTSLSIALRDTFPARLSIAKHLNDLRPARPSYQDLLRLDAEMREAYRRLCKSLQGLRNGGVTRFDSKFLDFIVRRYFLSLHIPWFGSALRDASFAYSRRVVVDTASRLWQTVSGDDDLSTLAICGAGFLRSIPMQACLVIATELRAQLIEEDSLGPKTPRPDLLAILHEARDWTLKRIEAGETNIKGYLSFCAGIAHIEALTQSLSDDEVHQAFVSITEESLHRCLAILQGRSQSRNGSDRMAEADGGWDMTDVQFGASEAESFFTLSPSWLLDDTSPSLSTW